MDLTNPDTLKSLLARFHIRPQEALGQNFLIDGQVLNNILAAADLSKADAVLEIGAGAGTLTQALAGKAGQVMAIEKDARLMPALRWLLKKFSNIEIINDDFLKMNVFQLLTAHRTQLTSFKVVANIPYYITGQLLQSLLTLSPKPRVIILLLQKEVGERICASPGQMSRLAVAVQFYGRPELVAAVSRRAFYPEPEVESVILKILPYSHPRLKVDEKLFFRLVKISFASRRKTLANNLAAGLRMKKPAAEQVIHQAGLGKSVRAQELSLEDWKKIYDSINEKPGL